MPWDGYPVKQAFAKALFENKNVVVLAGDTHNAWQNDLKNDTGQITARELTTASVSSPGFESFIGTAVAFTTQFEFTITTLIDDLQYFNASKKGYLSVEFSSAGDFKLDIYRYIRKCPVLNDWKLGEF